MLACEPAWAELWMLGTKELFGTFNGQAFHFVDIFHSRLVSAIEVVIYLAGLFAQR